MSRYKFSSGGVRRSSHMLPCWCSEFSRQHSSESGSRLLYSWVMMKGSSNFIRDRISLIANTYYQRLYIRKLISKHLFCKQLNHLFRYLVKLMRNSESEDKLYRSITWLYVRDNIDTTRSNNLHNIPGFDIFSKLI